MLKMNQIPEIENISQCLQIIYIKKYFLKFCKSRPIAETIHTSDKRK